METDYKPDLIGNQFKQSVGENAQDNISALISAERELKNLKYDTASYIMQGKKTPSQIIYDNKPILEKNNDQLTQLNSKIKKLLDRQQYEKLKAIEKTLDKPTDSQNNQKRFNPDEDSYYKNPLADKYPELSRRDKNLDRISELMEEPLLNHGLNVLEGIDEELEATKKYITLGDISVGSNKKKLGRKKGEGLIRTPSGQISRAKPKELHKKTGKKPPVFLSYGRLNIDSKKLQDGIVSVMFNDATNKPRRLKNRTVTNKCKEIIIQMLEGKNVDISKLSPAEQKYMIDLHNESRIKHIAVAGGGLVDDIKTLTHKFDVLVGEISAGNNSKEILNELSEIINGLVQKGVLSVKQAIAYSKKFIMDI